MSVERIVSAALDIIDRDGLDALSMRTLAAALETGTATIYRYIDSKEEVLVEALDAVLGEIQPPQEAPKRGDWRAQIAAIAKALRDGLLAHPNVTPLLAGSVPLGPNALAGREASLNVLIDAGFDPTMAARTYLAIVHYAIGFVLAEKPESAAYEAEHRRTLKRYYKLLPADRFPRIVALANELTARDNDQEFAFGLDLILDGVDHRTATRRQRSGR